MPCMPMQVGGVWPMAEPFISRSFAKSDQTIPSSLRFDLRDGHRVLWVVVLDQEKIIGAGITALFDLASGRMCKIEHFGGEQMPLWLDQVSVIEQYAREQGCDRVMFEGRPGWARKLASYRRTAIIMEKRL